MKLVLKHNVISSVNARRSRTYLVPRADAYTSGFQFGNKNGSKHARKENVPGSFFVDHTCIDCDTCRWMAPKTFHRAGEQSAVHQQPTSDEDVVRAYQALLSCPTFSIHAQESRPELLKAAQKGLPALVPGCERVYHCGWADEKAIATAAYLIVREAGNILVDSPRFNPVLCKQIDALGGVKYQSLTHRDDIGEHGKWQAHYGSQRIIHQLEVDKRTEDVEVKLSGQGPWKITGEELKEGEEEREDVVLVFTPGHTSGHVCLFHRDDKALMSGDHLAATDDYQGLEIFENFNWYSVPEQVRSVQKLLQYDFLHVLPGHGRPAHIKDATQRLQYITRLLEQHKQFV